MRLPLFFAVYSIIMKATTCSLRKLTKRNSPINAFLSGFLAGFISLNIQEKGTWFYWRMFLGARAMDMVYRTLVKKGILKDSGMNYTLGYCIGSFLISSQYFVEPINLLDCVPLYRKFAYSSQNETIWHWCTILRFERKFKDSLFL